MVGSTSHAIQIFEGIASVVYADGVEMVRLDQFRDSCLGVSLPKAGLVALKKSGPKRVSIKGLLMQVPSETEIATIHVNDRLVGFRQCDNKYVFVRSIRDIDWK